MLRVAVNELALHFLAKSKVMVIKDIDRDQVEFISKTLGVTPVAHIDHFTKEKLGTAGLVEEITAGGEKKIVKITGGSKTARTVSILLRGSN